MPEPHDDLEKLLADVRKTISDNRLFLEKLVNEAVDVDAEEDAGTVQGGEDFEEL